MSRWQNGPVWAGIFLGVGGSLLASLLYEWARPSPPDRESPRDTVQPQTPALSTKTAVKPLITAVVLVILARALKSSRRSTWNSQHEPEVSLHAVDPTVEARPLPPFGAAAGPVALVM